MLDGREARDGNARGIHACMHATSRGMHAWSAERNGNKMARRDSEWVGARARVAPAREVTAQ
eukprot:6470416-Prymnesium_polylepis.1